MATPERQRRAERILGGVALALLLLGCLWVMLPFLTSLLWGVVLTFTTWGVYQRLTAALGGRRTLAAAVMAIGIAMVLLLPFVVVGFKLADQVRALATAARQWVEAGPSDPPGWVGRIPMIGAWAANGWRTLASDTQRLLALGKQLIEPASTLLLALGLMVGRGLLELTLSILVAFFLYRDGGYVADRARVGARRIGGERGERLLKLAGTTVRSVVYGILGTALVQGVLAGIGLLVAGVPGAVALGFLTFFLSILPVGPPLVWIPATIWLFHEGRTGWGIFMICWGLVISSSDNVVRPWLISQGVKMPFILILFGVIGGALGFGFVGVFLGPALLAAGYALVIEWVAGKYVESAEAEAAETVPGPIGPVT